MTVNKHTINNLEVADITCKTSSLGGLRFCVARCEFWTNSNGPHVLRLEGLLLADEQSFVPRSLASVDRTYRYRGAAATSLSVLHWAKSRPKPPPAARSDWSRTAIRSRSMSRNPLPILRSRKANLRGVAHSHRSGVPPTSGDG